LKIILRLGFLERGIGMERKVSDGIGKARMGAERPESLAGIEILSQPGFF
jgi:hypothetical protein